MLAQYFMTSKELDILDEEYAALVKLLGMLERGEIVHKRIVHQVPIWFSVPIEERRPDFFNMRTVATSFHDCGTVCCLKGYAETFMKKDFSGRSLRDDLWALFFGKGANNSTTIEQAAQALRNYLTTGQADWDSVLKPA